MPLRESSESQKYHSHAKNCEAKKQEGKFLRSGLCLSVTELKSLRTSLLSNHYRTRCEAKCKPIYYHTPNDVQCRGNIKQKRKNRKHGMEVRAYVYRAHRYFLSLLKREKRLHHQESGIKSKIAVDLFHLLGHTQETWGRGGTQLLHINPGEYRQQSPAKIKPQVLKLHRLAK
jgi:hypothetical protein